MKKGNFWTGVFLLAVLTIACEQGWAQPIADSVKAIQKSNEKSYRQLALLDPYGESYSFTNVIKWHIVDPELSAQIRDVMQKDPFSVDPKTFRTDDIYLFCAPVAGTDRVEPFHILLEGQNIEAKKGKTRRRGEEGDDFSNAPKAHKVFQGKQVVHYLHRTNPTLFENINTIQGDNVEIPGEIVPHGSQLVKDSKMRYLFSKVFDQFYSKRVVLDEQRGYYGLPKSYDLYDLPPEVTAADSIKSPVDPETTTALPDDAASVNRVKAEYFAARAEKTVDLSITDLRVNASRNIGFEVEMGNKEVGLPFWSSGQSRFWIDLKNQIGTESNFKLGLVFPVPFAMGTSDWLTFNARKLSGTFGGSLDAYFAGISFFSGFNLPLAVKFSYMPSGQGSNNSIILNGAATTAPSLVDGHAVTIKAGQSFYREGLIFQLYIPTIVQLDLNNFVQASIGFGIDNVYQSIIPGKQFSTSTLPSNYIFTSDQANSIQDLARVSNTVSPHVEFDYVNQQAAKFGLSVAYDHLFTFGAWIELVEDRFRIEMSYSGPIIRDPKPYEPGSFFFITPRFYF
jgi:hypothetical protein